MNIFIISDPSDFEYLSYLKRGLSAHNSNSTVKSCEDVALGEFRDDVFEKSVLNSDIIILLLTADFFARSHETIESISTLAFNKTYYIKLFHFDDKALASYSFKSFNIRRYHVYQDTLPDEPIIFSNLFQNHSGIISKTPYFDKYHMLLADAIGQSYLVLNQNNILNSYVESELRSINQSLENTIFLDFEEILDKTPLRTRFQDKNNQNKPISFTEMLTQCQSCVIQGNAGSGKTTTLNQLAREWLKSYKSNPSSKLPILINLKKQINYNDKDSLLDSIAAKIKQNITKSFVQGLVRNNKLILLFDGFNEVQSQDLHNCKLMIENFCDLHPQTPCIVARREMGLIPEVGDWIINICKLTFPQIKEISESILKEKSDAFLLDIQRELGLYHMSKNPLLLFMILTIYKKYESIPSQKGEMFNTFFNHIFVREEEKKSESIDIDEKFLILQILAFEMLNQNMARSISKNKMINLLGECLSRLQKNRLINVNLSSHQVLKELQYNRILNGYDDISFYHQDFQDFFAAKEISRKVDIGHLEEIVNIMKDKKWEDVLVFLPGICEENFFVQNLIDFNLPLAAKLAKLSNDDSHLTSLKPYILKHLSSSNPDQNDLAYEALEHIIDDSYKNILVDMLGTNIPNKRRVVRILFHLNFYQGELDNVLKSFSDNDFALKESIIDLLAHNDNYRFVDWETNKVYKERIYEYLVDSASASPSIIELENFLANQHNDN